MLLTRVVARTGDTWRNLRHKLDRTVATADGRPTREPIFGREGWRTARRRAVPA